MKASIEQAGVWAIALGALAVAGSLVFGSATPHDAIRVKAEFKSRPDRLWFGLAAAGAVLVGLGSVFLAIASPPGWPALAMVGLLLLAFHLASAWKLHQLTSRRYRNNKRNKDNPDVPYEERVTMQRWHLTWEKQATWRWCLLHTYSHVPARPDE